MGEKSPNLVTLAFSRNQSGAAQDKNRVLRRFFFAFGDFFQTVFEFTLLQKDKQ
jgi:hypothetical protein